MVSTICCTIPTYNDTAVKHFHAFPEKIRRSFWF